MKYSIVLVNSRRITHTIIGSVLVFLSSCDFSKQEKIAQVDDFVLYEEEVLEHLEKMELSSNNQEAFELYVDDWINRKVVTLELNKADALLAYQNDYKAKQNKYELDLFALENILIEMVVDSTISEDEILSYYQKNRSNYVSKSYIVKALYIKIPDSIPAVEQLKKVFLLKNDKDRNEVKKYGNLYATHFYFEEEKWIFFDDLVRDIPMTDNAKTNLILNRDDAIFTDKNDIYFLNILDYKEKRANEPLEFEKNKIRKHILKRRINNLREEIRQNILNDAKEKHSITHY